MNKPTVVKVVLLGSSGVGKSSIIYRYVTNDWDESMQTTLGASFMDKQITYQGIHFKFQIWDTAGQEKYAPLAQMYYRDANVALMVYDITNRESFYNLKTWYLELAEKGPKNISLAIVGNKCDLRDNEQVSTSEGEKYAADCNALFMKTSAKENLGVTELFECICDKLIQEMNLDEQEVDPFKSKLIPPSKQPKQEKKCCG